MPQRGRLTHDSGIDLRERLRAVDFRFAFAEQVEVGPVQDQDAHPVGLLWRKRRAFAPEADMPDTIMTASSADGALALAAAITTELAGEIRDRHDLWPTATAAVGRLTTGAVILAANLKRHERISLQIAGDGPLGNVAADAWLLDDETIGARGFARNGRVELPVDSRGKFDVAAAIGAGSLQVTR